MLTIKYDAGLKLYIAFKDGEAFMKNSTESKLYKKLSIWLNSQSR